MNELLNLLTQIDWPSLMVGAGVVASALGFGFGMPLVAAGKTLKEVREVMEAVPLKNHIFQITAEVKKKARAQKELAKLSKEN